VVFYTGVFRWERLGALADLMDDVEGLEGHLPAFAPIFVNLPEVSEEELIRGGPFGQILKVLKTRKASQPTFRGVLAQAVAALGAMPIEERSRRQDLLSYLTQAVYHYRVPSERGDMISVIEQAANTDEMKLEVEMARRTIADEIGDEREILALRQVLLLQLK